MIKINYRKHKRSTKLAFIGVLLSFTGLLVYIFSPIVNGAEYLCSMQPGTLFHSLWQAPPLESLINVYIFNITNYEAFLAHKEKMHVVEVGPYVYSETLHNTESRFNENGTLTYIPRRFLRFVPEKSIGDPMVDKVVAPNIPLLAMASFLKDYNFLMNIALYQIANMIDAQLFLNLTIDQYLFGYDDRLVSLANNALPNWINFERLGIMDRLMALDNSSNVVTVKLTPDIMTSTSYISRAERSLPFTITEFNGSPGLSQWGYRDVAANATIPQTNTRCNTVEGAIEGLFPRDFNKTAPLRVYRRAFCRAVNLHYHSTSYMNGFIVYNYTMDDKLFETGENYAENACYCYKGRCAPKGIGFLHPCYYGMPVVISHPHFYNADPMYLDQVLGLTPDHNRHTGYIIVNPTMGVPLDARLRIQLNLAVDTKYSSKLAIFNNITIPLFWIDLSVGEVPFVIYLTLSLITYIAPITQLVVILGLVVWGVGMIAFALTLIFAKQRNADDDYAPIRILPMRQYLSATAIRISK